MGWLDKVSILPAGLAYLVVAGLVFLEDAALLGLVVPGETAAVLGGVSASLGHTDLAWMIVIVVVAATVGDSVGYELGRRYGVRLLEIRPLARRRERLDHAAAVLAQRGGPAVFLGRFVAFLRTATPFLAGASHMRYRTFLFYNATGAVAWGVGSVLLGYVAGLSYRMAARTFGGATAAVVAALLIVALIVFWRRRRRH